MRISRFYQRCFLLLLLRPLRILTASAGSQWALPDLNCLLRISMGTSGASQRAPDSSGHCRASTATSRAQWALPRCQTPTGEYGARDMKRKTMEKYKPSCGTAQSWFRAGEEFGRGPKQAERQAAMTAKKSDLDLEKKMRKFRRMTVKIGMSVSWEMKWRYPHGTV